ncbi:MAG: inositol monophosphatase family protein [Woeseiaceae bacterium]|nr:inositol monophosphatase family protein [Woeseiaceae bacterium]
MAQKVQSPELSIALQAAEAAAKICRANYGREIAVDTKPDMTPVTRVDVECEKAIRTLILEAFPDHGFHGEESGRSGAGAENVWLVDPIDGTKSFIRGYPFFSTQIALLRGDDIVLGVSCGMMFDELAWAERGCGAWLNGERIRVSDIDDLEQATISTGNLRSLAKSKDGWPRLGELVARAWRTRGYGDFYHYHLLAAGKIEAVIESDVDILDIAAVSVIVEEAGGVFTDLNGQRPGMDSRSVLAANAALHATYLAQLEGSVD